MNRLSLLRRCALASPAVVLVTIGAGLYASGSLTRLLARSEGYVIVVEEPTREFTARPDEVLTASFDVTNVLPEPVKIVGVETGCGCTSVEPIPATLAAGETLPLRFTFDMHGGKAGTVFRLDPTIFVDRASPPNRLSVRIRLAKTEEEN
ncbi:MAG: DUF1573 domain-containing protein [Planctomycetaceae bacterium]|nr:DUF1573 domain-containing protein [Planctomycetaceae bacterium]